MAAPIKEYREFFLRATQVSSGSKADQELGFPAQYQVFDCNGNPITAFNRFLKSHVPSEDVFKKLFESLTFKLNTEDTATVDNHGLVKIAIGDNIVNRVDVENDFTTIVVPSELPTVVGDNVTAQIISVATGLPVTSIPVGDRGLYHIQYTVQPNISLTTAKTNFDSQNADGFEYLVYDTNQASLSSFTIPADTLNTDGDCINFVTHIDNITQSWFSARGFSIYTGAVGAEVALFNDIADGVGTDPNITGASHHTHVEGNFYRIDAATGKFIVKTTYYTRPNSGTGFSLHKSPSSTDVSYSTQAVVFRQFDVAIDWTADQEIHFVVDVTAAAMNTTNFFFTNFAKLITN